VPESDVLSPLGCTRFQDAFLSRDPQHPAPERILELLGAAEVPVRAAVAPIMSKDTGSPRPPAFR
jgi:hypothetical protein